MPEKKRFSILTIFIIIVLCAGLTNVNAAFADEGTPTDPPPATEAATEVVTEVATEAPTEEPTQVVVDTATEPPVVEATSAPVDATPAPVEETATPGPDMSQVPTDTAVVVLDQSGDAVPLATQEAAAIVNSTDPMWCPAGTSPGGANCTTNFPDITSLINDMIANTGSYSQNGVIYFTTTAGSSFALTTGSLGAGDFGTLSGYNLTLQGGWNGVNGSTTFTQTNFGANTLTVGTAANPWAGNITLNDFVFSDVSSGNAVTVYTSSGNITLNNVDVGQQTGNTYTAYLNSNSGSITVQNGSTFDGRNSGGGNPQNQGFYANSTSGSINITGTSGNPITFTDAFGTGATNYNGATLSAPSVTLNYVSASSNDGYGISITGATNSLTLNNVTANNNGLGGINIPSAGNVSIQNTTASNNTGNGITVANATSANFSNTTTSNNTINGIAVSGTNLVTLNNITATNNGTVVPGQGANNDIGSGVRIDGTGTTRVILSGTSTYNNNRRYAIEVFNVLNNTIYATGVVGGTCNGTNNTNGNGLGCFNVPTTIDNSAPVVTYTISGTLGANGWYTSNVTVTWTVTDAESGILSGCSPTTFSSDTSGVTATCTATNNVGLSTTVTTTSIKIDKTPPVVTLSVTSGTPGSNGWYVSSVTVHTNFTETMSNPVTCTALDQNLSSETTSTVVSATCTNNAGLSSTATLNVKIDLTPPSLSLPSNITAEATGSAGATVSFSATGSDSTSSPVGVSCSPASGATFPLGTTTVNCTATNNAGLSTSGSFTVTVQDTTPPTLTLPSNMTVEATGPSGAVVTFSASASDIVDGALPVTCVPASGSTFALGTATVNCSAADAHGNTATGSFTITVQDTTPPALTLPSNMTVEATGPLGAVVTFSASATDIVDGALSVTCSPASGSTFPLGTTTVNCSATDAHSNTTSGSFTVTVQDTTPPALTLPSNMTVEATGPSGASVSFTVSATDIVDGPVTVSCNHNSGETFPLGTTTVTCSATDAHGNTASGSFTVTVQDTTPPVVTVPGDITVEATGSSGASVTFSASANDIVDGALPVTCSPVSGSTFSLGTTSVTCTATDKAGNTGSASFNVIVQDTTPPVVTVPANMTVEATGPSGASVTFSASANDIVDGALPATCVPASGSTFALGTTSVTCSATDNAGNTGSASFNVTVRDTTAPTVTVPANMTVEATGPLGASVSFSASANDLVDGALPVTCVPASGSTFSLGTTSVTCSATDKAGNTGSASFNVTVQDTTAPVLTLPSNMTVEATGPSGASVSFTVSATDIVDGSVAVSCNHNSGDTFPLGTTTVTCSATDAHGNTASGSFTVTVQDTTPPLLTLPSNMTVEATSASGAVVTFTVSATDIVDGSVAVSCNHNSGDTFPLGTTTVTCSATDAHGNTASGSFTVTVQDTTPPAVTVPADMIVEATGPTGAVVTFSASANDIVDGALPAACSPTSGSTFALGTTSVTCTATDNAGNTGSASFNVTVQDTTAPIIAPHADMTLEATSSAGRTVNYAPPSTTDAVDGSGTATCVPAPGSVFPLGDTTVTCNATDSHGNSATPTSFVIHIVDTTAPVIASHPDVTVEATSAAGATVIYTSPSTTDLVDGTGTATCLPASGAVFALGNTTVTCNATDSHGNSATPTSFVVHVVDTTPPLIASHPDMVVEATGPAGATVTYTSPSTTDAVDGPGVASCSPASGGVFPLGDTTVTCTATDAHGNVATPVSFVVHVVDSTMPTLTLPADMTIEATGPAGATVNFAASAFDLVDGAVPVSCSPSSGSTFGFGTTTVNCSATDADNNTSNGSFNVTVQDTTPPVISSHSNLTVTTSTNSAAVNYTDPATSDVVDGAGTATCTPPSGSVFKLGTTLITCTATDAHGNSAQPVTFNITVNFVSRPGGGGTPGVIPVTGDSFDYIGCGSKSISFLVEPERKIKVTFYNLCGYQTLLYKVDTAILPEKLPTGATFVSGLNATVFKGGKLVDPLPTQSSMKIEFPVPANSSASFTVLLWKDGKWIEVAGEKTKDGFYTINTNQTGTFVLVTK